MVAINANGNAVPASATTTTANALKVIGRAEYVVNGIPAQNAVNNPGAAGAISDRGAQGRVHVSQDSSITAASVGQPMLRARRQQRDRDRSRLGRHRCSSTRSRAKWSRSIRRAKCGSISGIRRRWPRRRSRTDQGVRTKMEIICAEPIRTFHRLRCRLSARLRKTAFILRSRSARSCAPRAG